MARLFATKLPGNSMGNRWPLQQNVLEQLDTHTLTLNRVQKLM